MKKRLLAGILSVAMMLSLVACGASGGTSTPNAGSGETAGTKKDTITFAYEAEPANLHPQGNNIIAAYYITYMIHNGLYKNTVNGPELDLAESATTEKDENGLDTIWVFKIRDDAKFSTGDPVTAEDVAATLNAAKESSIKAQAAFYEKAEAVDANTVKLYTNGVYSAVPDALANKMFYIMPAKLLENGHDFNNEPIGSGPYKLVEWKKGESITLTYNEHYYGEEPEIKNIVWKIMAEGTTRTIALESGDVDFVVSVDAMDVARLQDNSDYTVSITNGSMFTYILPHNMKEPFSDINFRKFMAAAIDREAVIDVALGGYGTPLTSCVNVNVPGYTEEGAQGYDPEAAKQYLAAWGGDPSTIKFSMLASTDVRRRIAEVVQSNLGEYGIQVEVSMVEPANLSPTVASGEYETSVFAYTTNYFMAYANNLYINNQSYGGYMMGQQNRFDDAVNEISATLDAAKRKDLITAVNKEINEYQPMIPIYCSQVLLAYDSALSGVEVDSMGFFHIEDFTWN